GSVACRGASTDHLRQGFRQAGLSYGSTCLVRDHPFSSEIAFTGLPVAFRCCRALAVGCLGRSLQCRHGGPVASCSPSVVVPVSPQSPFRTHNLRGRRLMWRIAEILGDMLLPPSKALRRVDSRPLLTDVEGLRQTESLLLNHGGLQLV